MTDVTAREKLLRYLDQQVFQPILSRDPESFGEGLQTAFDELQERTRRTWERLRSCRSADAVLDEFDRQCCT